MSSGKCRPFCLGLNVLNDLVFYIFTASLARPIGSVGPVKRWKYKKTKLFNDIGYTHPQRLISTEFWLQSETMSAHTESTGRGGPTWPKPCWHIVHQNVSYTIRYDNSYTCHLHFRWSCSMFRGAPAENNQQIDPQINHTRPGEVHQNAWPKKVMLTHCDRDKMAAISQTTLWNAFSWMKMQGFRLKFHWS